jgi:catechol 2,3-dioxygenase-like lactoylglutathione lyase family enzyme
MGGFQDKKTLASNSTKSRNIRNSWHAKTWRLGVHCREAAPEIEIPIWMQNREPGGLLGHFQEEDIAMEQIVTKLVSEFEQGKLSRRQLIKGLTLAVTVGSALSAVPAAAADDKMVPAIYINHVSYQVTDYARTRDFYAGLFGMKVVEDDGKTQCRLLFGDNILAVRNAATRPDKKLGVDHIAYTIADWDAEQDAYLAEIKRRGLKLTGGSDLLDPDGFRVQFGGYKQ